MRVTGTGLGGLTVIVTDIANAQYIAQHNMSRGPNDNVNFNSLALATALPSQSELQYGLSLLHVPPPTQNRQILPPGNAGREFRMSHFRRSESLVPTRIAT